MLLIRPWPTTSAFPPGSRGASARCPWRCAVTGSAKSWPMWDDFYYQQVEQWTSIHDSTTSSSQQHCPHPPHPHPTRDVRAHTSGSRYHASASSGPWGFHVDRDRRSEDWRGQTFEWEGPRRRTADQQQQQQTHQTYTAIPWLRDIVREKINLYQLLGVPPFADIRQIRKGYRAMARKFHPDAIAQTQKQVMHPLNGDRPPSPDQFLRIRQAMEILGDPQRRTLYDDVLNSFWQANSRHSTASPLVHKNPPHPVETGQSQLQDSDWDEFVLQTWTSRPCT